MNSFRKNSFSFVFLPALTIRVAASFLYINTLAAFQERRCEVFYYSLPTMHLSRQNHAQEQTARCSAYSLCQALRVTVKFCATCSTPTVYAAFSPTLCNGVERKSCLVSLHAVPGATGSSQGSTAMQSMQQNQHRVYALFTFIAAPAIILQFCTYRP